MRARPIWRSAVSFAPFGAYIMLCTYPRLAPWAVFLPPRCGCEVSIPTFRNNREACGTFVPYLLLWSSR